MSDDVASGGHCREKVGRGEGEICIWAGAGQTRTWHLLWLHQIRLAQTFRHLDVPHLLMWVPTPISGQWKGGRTRISIS